MELSEKKAKSLQAIMMREIEEYIEKNMAEMHKSLEELRISFEDEIKSVDGKLILKKLIEFYFSKFNSLFFYFRGSISRCR
jgi:hypothetical protein